MPAPEGKGEGEGKGKGKGKGKAIYAAYDAQGAFKGYAVPAEGSGFQDTISLIYGLDPASRHIIGFSVLESRETPSLGDKINKDVDFLANFHELAVEPTIIGVKKGAKAAPNEIDCITGATISSKSVVKILNTSTGTWLSELPPAGQGPATAAGGSDGKP